MAEGIAPQQQSSGALDALQFFKPNETSLVGSLLSDIQSTQISSAMFVLNLVAFAIALCIFVPKLWARAVVVGGTGEIDSDRATSAWAIKCWLAILLVTPVPDFSVGQRLVIFLTSAGSALGDRIAVATGPARDSMRLRLQQYGAARSGTTPAEPTASISPEGSTITARIFEFRWCQLHVVSAQQNQSGGRPTTLPAPTEIKRFDGTTVLRFGAGDAGSSIGGIAEDICGSVSLPLPAETRAKATTTLQKVALLVQNVSDVSRPILDAHRVAIDAASTAAAVAVLSYPISVRDAHRADATVAEARGRMRDAAVAAARAYDKTVSAAGGAALRAGQKQTPAGTANALDIRWGWINFGLDFHQRAAAVTAAAAALSWVPQFSPPSITDQLAPAWKQNYSFMQDDLRSAGLIPIVPPSALGKDTSGSGFDIAALVGADKIIGAMRIFGDPSADVFEVAALVGPMFSQIASVGLVTYAVVSAAIPGVGSFLSMLLGTMLLIGQTLSVVVPMAPLLGWLMLILGWFVLVVTTIFAISFASIALIRDDSPDLLGGAVTPLISKILTLLFLPALLVLGMTLITPILQLAWLILASSIMPIAVAAQQGSALGVVLGGVIAALFVISTVVSLVYYSITKIAAVPAAVAEFMQAHGEKTPGVGERVTGSEQISSTPALSRAGSPPGKPPTPGSGGGNGGGGNIVAGSVPPPR
jgi:hypothetical protein